MTGKPYSKSQPTWDESAKRAAEAAIGLYERGSVEYELALYLLRALRELERK